MRKHFLLGFVGLSVTASFIVAAIGCNTKLVVGVGDSPLAPSGAGCPTAHGPSMALIPVSGGSAYCIDRTEVTQAQYDAFLGAGVSATGTGKCGYKSSHAPGQDPGDLDEQNACRPDQTHFDPATTPDLPVVCVDWCDAEAYCGWAGKHLCGQIGGGVSADPGNAGTDEWQRACSNGGATTLPYGDDYAAGVCTVSAELEPVGTAADCHGTAEPYAGVYDMMGSVAEWVNAGTQGFLGGGEGGASADFAYVRGSAPDALSLTGSPLLRCWGQAPGHSGQAAPGVNYPTTLIGFRCCADATADASAR